MTDLQRVELDMLAKTVDICNKLGIRYYLVCGTALGAVKYGGFIPWDDDVDIGIFREDYNRFLREAPKLLPKELFLQTNDTDPGYTNIFAKIRNNNTTYIEKSVKNIKMHHGVYIDVFPLDGYPKDVKQQKKLEKKKRLYRKLLSCNYTVPRSLTGRLSTKLLRIMGFHKRTGKIISKYTKMVSACPVAGSDLICNHGNWQGSLEYAPKHQYGEGVAASFEGLTVRVPERYDEYLTQKYGNWRADLPEEEKVGHHYYSIMDLDKSYVEYTR